MINLLSSSAFIILNKELARQVGLKEAVLLADLISKEEYFIDNGITDGWFFNTEANIENDTTLNSYQQRKCLKEQVLQILKNLSYKKPTTINKNKEIKIINKYFKRPKDIEVKIYCIERQNNVDYEAFCNFYDSKNWMVGKHKMKDWKAAVRTWEKRSYKKSTMSKLDAQISQYEQAKKLL